MAKRNQKPRTGRPPMAHAAKKSEGIGIRVKPDLRGRLEKAATAKGHSLSAEIAYRLESSFSEESAWGGKAERDLAQLIAVRFISAGQQAAEISLGTDAKAEQWLTDKHAYDQALLGVVAALWARRPGPRTMEDTRDLFGSLQGRLVSILINDPKGRIE